MKVVSRYAGHMATAEAILRQMLPAVDVVWEVADARCPQASRNRRLEGLCGGKPRLLVLASADLADPAQTARWLRHFGETAVALDLRHSMQGDVDELWRRSRQAVAAAGRKPHGPGRLRAMVVGMPNTGKSTLLNRVSGMRHLAVADRPGVTRGQQWLASADEGMLLDMPGVLPMRLGPWPVAWRLWAVGILAVDALDAELACQELLPAIAARAPAAGASRYGMALSEPEILVAIAQRRGLLATGGRPDVAAAAAVVRGEFAKGLLGRVSLEAPEE